MFVGATFPSDNNEDLMLIQHDLWFKVNGAFIDEDSFALSSCFYIFWCARKAIFGFINENPLFFPEIEQLKAINSFDHRVLQNAHNKIAAFYRWIQGASLKPAFDDGNTYGDWSNKLLSLGIYGRPNLYNSYLLDCWKMYLRFELLDISFNHIAVSEHIVRAVLFQNTEQGYKAEDSIDKFLIFRYGSEFDSLLRNFGSR